MRCQVIPLFAAVACSAAEHQSAPFFKLLDRDGNGRIALEEVQRSPWVARLDTDGDGAVNAPELAAGWDNFASLRVTLAERFPAALGYPGSATADGQDAGSPREGPRPLSPGECGVGTMMPDMKVKVVGGGETSLGALAGGRPLVIALVSTSCPVGRRYLPTLLDLKERYSGRGVSFVFLAPTATDTDEELIAALPRGIILRDPQKGLLKTLGATSKTDCFLLDARRTLQYRGAVDDQYGLGYSLESPRRHLLADALDAVIEGRTPGVAATQAPGCELDLSDAEPARMAEVTYHNRISRIFAQHCEECHREGGVAPFALTTYEEIGEHAGMIRKMVDKRLMPPWFAARVDGEGHSPWENDRSMPERDRADLLAWLGAGRALGDAKDAPLPRRWPDGEWSIGKPDAIFQIPKPIAVKATGTMPYQTVRVPTDFKQTRYISAVEVLPTVREVVHHVLVYADAPNARFARLRQVLQGGRFRQGDDDESGGFFAIYVPGNNTLVYPEGFGKPLPAGATLRFQIHYTPNGTPVSEQVRVGMKFTKEPPKHIVLNAGISSRHFAIPPGDPDYRVEAKLPVPRDAVVLAFLPHMHLRGKAWRYEVTQPGGASKILLDVPRYDFNWQLLYRYAEPRLLPAGSVIKATAWFDNSAQNPANPDPGATVRWGPQTTDEMMLGYIEFYFR